MADNQTVETPQAVASVATPAVVVDAPVITESAPSPTLPSESAAAPTQKTDVVAEPSAVESVLGDAPKVEAKVETKPEVKAEIKETPKADAKPAEGITPETPAEVVAPVYEAFKLPEGIELPAEKLEGFTKILGEIESGKLDHAAMQEKGQALVDLATQVTKESMDRMNDYYVQIHEGAKKARLDALKADPDLGGDKFTDTVTTLQAAINEYGGTEAQVAEFRKEVVEAGLDASPALCRLLFNMQQKINKYTTESDNGNGGSNRIVPAARPAPSKVKDYQRFYAGGNS